MTHPIPGRWWFHAYNFCSFDHKRVSNQEDVDDFDAWFVWKGCLQMKYRKKGEMKATQFDDQLVWSEIVANVDEFCGGVYGTLLMVWLSWNWWWYISIR